MLTVIWRPDRERYLYFWAFRDGTFSGAKQLKKGENCTFFDFGADIYYIWTEKQLETEKRFIPLLKQTYTTFAKGLEKGKMQIPSDIYYLPCQGERSNTKTE